VVRDITSQLGPKLQVRRGPLTRATLRLQNMYLPTQAERMAWLAHHLPQLPGAGIVYTLTVKDADRVARWLRSRRIDAEAYHAKMETEVRETLERRLLENDLKVLVATVALGMGFDKPDLGFVVHFQRPASVVHYYQQVGRAGRAVEEAYGILMNGEEDDDIVEYFMRTAFPSGDDVARLLSFLESAAGPVSVSKLQQEINLSRGAIDKTLKFLSLETPSPIQKFPSGYALNPVLWKMPFERIEAITDLRVAEHARMREYMATGDCLMQFLAAELDDRHAVPCGICANCAGGLLPEDYPGDLAQLAVEFLDRAEKPAPHAQKMAAGHGGRQPGR